MRPNQLRPLIAETPVSANHTGATADRSLDEKTKFCRTGNVAICLKQSGQILELRPNQDGDQANASRKILPVARDSAGAQRRTARAEHVATCACGSAREKPSAGERKIARIASRATALLGMLPGRWRTQRVGAQQRQRAAPSARSSPCHEAPLAPFLRVVERSGFRPQDQPYDLRAMGVTARYLRATNRAFDDASR
jgi:hypothetical protein